jgi:hypothetical protein
MVPELIETMPKIQTITVGMGTQSAHMADVAHNPASHVGARQLTNEPGSR